jgi:hypothetical protein
LQGAYLGDITVNIFLRELRGIWPKAHPALSARALTAAKAPGFVPAAMRGPDRALQALMRVWKADRGRTKDFPAFEAVLVRYEAVLRRQN